ncbi:MAG: NAD(P)/FAD-dependent oxidoreductase [Candidatus Zixiibacteriota bacterium]
MKTRYQVVIIGAGPAGCYAALTAARGGLEVLLVERDAEIGKPLCCAEGVSHIGLSNFVEPKEEFISQSIDGLELIISSGKTAVFRPGGIMGYVLDRYRFENYLADSAVALGVDLHKKTYASDIKIDSGKPAVVTLQSEDGSTDVTSDFVIACDGVESLIGRKIGVDTGLRLKQCETAMQYRVSGINCDSRLLRFYVGPRYSPNGYLWVFPKSDTVANIGVGLNPGEADHAQLRELLDRFIHDYFPNGKIEFEGCGCVPKFIGFEILGRENVLLAGDAARTIDSLSGAGIARALHTGKLAAESCIEAVKKNLSREKLQERYRKQVDKEIGRDMRILQKAYPIIRKFTEGDWDALADFLNSYLKNKTAESVDPAALIKSALTTAPGLIRLARHVF